jgi:hypothetical protein
VLTAAQIEAADALLENGKLKEVAQQQWLILIRSLPRYQKSPGLYPNLSTKLAQASGTTAKILQAALTAIEALGPGAEKLGSDNSKGVSWSRESNRTEFISDGLNALYDVPAQRPTSAVRHMSAVCSVHHCSTAVCGCSPCGNTRLIF